MSEAQKKTVRKVCGLHPVQGPRPVLPFFTQSVTVASDDVVASTPGVSGANLEASSKDDAVNFMFDTIGYHSIGSDAFNTCTLSIDQRHVGQVERWKVFVMKARSFAKLAVPGLQSLCRSGIFDHVIDTVSDGVHFLIVGHLHQMTLLPARDPSPEFSSSQLGSSAGQVSEDIGPSVRHEVFILIPASDKGIEVVHSSVLPAALEGGRPLWVRFTIVSVVNRRWCSLEHIKMFGGFTKVGDALDSSSTGPDNRDFLVIQAVQIAAVIPTGVLVIPPTGMKSVSLEIGDTRYTGEFRSVQRAVCHRYELGSHLVAAVSFDGPTRRVFVPT